MKDVTDARPVAALVFFTTDVYEEPDAASSQHP
jgi:hypothetical protein